MIPEERRILVVKLADIGDAVLSLPAVQALKLAYPGNPIDVLTTEIGSSVFRLSSSIDTVITLEKHRFDNPAGLLSPRAFLDLASLGLRLRRTGYAAVVLLHHLTTGFGARKFSVLVRTAGAPVVAGLENGRGWFLTRRAEDYGFGARTEWEYGLEVVRQLGARNHALRPELSLPSVSERAIEQLLRDHGIAGEFVLLHPEVGGFSPARSWPVERYLDVSRALRARFGIPSVAVGTDATSSAAQTLDGEEGVVSLIGKTSFEELCALVARARLVVAGDSAVAHLAGAFERPAVTLFGPTNVHAWRPYGSAETRLDSLPVELSSALALHTGIPCSPCIYTGFRLGRPDGCPVRTCMMGISSDDVVATAGSLLSRDA